MYSVFICGYPCIMKNVPSMYINIFFFFYIYVVIYLYKYIKKILLFICVHTLGAF